YRQPCDWSRITRLNFAPVAVLHLLRLSGHDSPGWPIRRFWPRGVLREPRQCSIACLGPCLSRGIRSNGERAVTAVVSSRSIPPRWTSVSHSLFNPAQPEAELISVLSASLR